MKVQSIDQFDGAVVRDCDGRRIGRVVGARAGADLFTMDWLVVWVPWRGRRAIPIGDAVSTVTGLRVDVRKATVVASPLVRDAALAAPADQATVAAHYAPSTPVSPR